MSENENIHEGAATGNQNSVPDDVLIILPIRNTVVFPGAVIPLTIGRRVSLAAGEMAGTIWRAAAARAGEIRLAIG